MSFGETVLVGSLGEGTTSKPIKIVDVSTSDERILLLVGEDGCVLKKEYNTFRDVRRALGQMIADADTTYTLQLADISEECKVNMPKSMLADLRHWCIF